MTELTVTHDQLDHSPKTAASVSGPGWMGVLNGLKVSARKRSGGAVMSLGYVLRLIPSRPTFPMDITDEERTVMGLHAAHWQPEIDAGRMVAFGPVDGDAGSWGLGLLETADERRQCLS